jgi:hypothetical protein
MIDFDSVKAVVGAAGGLIAASGGANRSLPLGAQDT